METDGVGKRLWERLSLVFAIWLIPVAGVALAARSRCSPKLR